MNTDENFEDREVIEAVREAYGPLDAEARSRVRARVVAARREAASPAPVPARGRSRSRRLVRRPAKSRALVLSGAGLLLAVSVALAASGIANLGKPVNVVSPNAYFPLSGFHRVHVALQSHGKPVLVMLGTEWDGSSAIERWPVVKALGEFGTFSRLKAATSGIAPPDLLAMPTFDWTHAKYTSRYVAFDHKDLLDTHAHALQEMSSTEKKLYYKYARVTASPYTNGAAPGAPLYVMGTVLSHSSRGLPLVVVGGYVQTRSQVMVPGDFEAVTTPPTSQTTLNLPPKALPFDTVQSALADEKDPQFTHLVEDVNAEANIITALICHADGGKPGAVCKQPAIRSILKHVK